METNTTGICNKKNTKTDIQHLTFMKAKFNKIGMCTISFNSKDLKEKEIRNRIKRLLN